METSTVKQTKNKHIKGLPLLKCHKTCSVHPFLQEATPNSTFKGARNGQIV